jgi:drug/metabolite transporter, DME family
VQVEVFRGGFPVQARLVDERRVGLAAIALAAGLWAIAATAASRLFDRGVDPIELSGARAVIAALGLSSVGWRRRVRQRVSPLLMAALGLSIALVNVAYYLAIDRLAVALAIVLQYTAPALVVSWVALTARRAPSREILLALIVAVAGVALATEVPAGDIGSIDGLGIAFGLVSAVLFAAYTLLSERAGRAYGSIGAMTRAFGAAALFWILVQVPRGWPGDLFEPENLPLVLFVGLGGTLAPFLLYVWGVGRVRSERATIAATLEPVLAAVFAWMLLDQSPSSMQIAGGLLVIGAVAMLQVARHESARAPEP